MDLLVCREDRLALNTSPWPAAAYASVQSAGMGGASNPAVHALRKRAYTVSMLSSAATTLDPGASRSQMEATRSPWHDKQSLPLQE